MREAQEWIKLIPRYKNTNRGGGLVKLDSETLRLALGYADIPMDTPLLVRRYPVKGNKGTAEIIIKLKPCKPKLKHKGI